MLNSRFDHLADLDLCLDLDARRRDLCIVLVYLIGIAGHLNKSETAGTWFVVFKHVKRMQAGMEAVAAKLDLTVLLKSLANLVLEVAAGPILVEALISSDGHSLSLLVGVIASLKPAYENRTHPAREKCSVSDLFYRQYPLDLSNCSGVDPLTASDRDMRRSAGERLRWASVMDQNGISSSSMFGMPSPPNPPELPPPPDP